MILQPVHPAVRLVAGVFLAAFSLGVASAQPIGPNDPDSSPMMRRRAPQVPIFFPPFPPPLDRPIQRGVTFLPGGLAAPAELASYINEPFYPQLGTRLYLHSLNEAQRKRVDDYLAAKRTLQAELHATLDRSHDAAPAERLAALEALARVQTPKLLALEATAEALRRDLLAPGASWNELREWHLTDREERGYSPVEIAAVLRACAYFEDDLLPAQRRLLREIAIELLNAADSADRATAAQPFVFFPPEPARITFADDLPAALAAKVAAFQTKKSLLKKEMYDAVTKSDGATLVFLRHPLRSLASKQEAGLAELDSLAEEIRRGLAALPPKARAQERSPLPAAVTSRLVAVLRNRAAAQREASTKVEAIVERSADLAVRYRFDDDGLRFSVMSPRALRAGGTSPEIAHRVDEVRAELTAVAEEYQHRTAEFVAERDAIRQDAGKFLGTDEVGRIDAALTTANRLAAQAENEMAYHDYRTAVFEPGLSAPQRRMLFDTAIEQLELPLPRGEPQPVFRAPRW